MYLVSMKGAYSSFSRRYAPRTKRIRTAAIWDGNNDRKSLSPGRKTILLSNSITLARGESEKRGTKRKLIIASIGSKKTRILW